MGIFDRALLALYSFIMGILSVYVIFLSFGWDIIRQILNFTLNNPGQRTVLGFLGFVFFLISVRLFITATHKVKPVSSTVVQETSLGQIRVTLEALESMVRRAVGPVKGIREITPHIVCDPTGVSIIVRAVVSHDTSVPDVTTEIQDKVKEYLQQVAGITVHAVKILVENVSSDVRGRVD